MIISGFPCCGKTTFAHRLVEYLKGQGLDKIKLINEESESISKHDGYQDTFNEKKARGALKSAVDHALDTECVVILDSMNYIKGYRYELFCLAKTLRTPHCCVWVESDDTLSEEWNSARKAADGAAGYDASIMLELRRRYEQPNAKNRWDNPLFRVNMTPTSTTVGDSGDSSNAGTVFTTMESAAAATDAVSAPSSSSWRPRSKAAVAEGTADGTAKPPIVSSFRRTTPVHAPTAIDDTQSIIGNSSISGATIATNALSFSGFTRTAPSAKNTQTPDGIMSLLHQHLTSAATATPNSSTILAPLVEADSLHELDRWVGGLLRQISSCPSYRMRFLPLYRVLSDLVASSAMTLLRPRCCLTVAYCSLTLHETSPHFALVTSPSSLRPPPFASTISVHAQDQPDDHATHRATPDGQRRRYGGNNNCKLQLS